MAVNYLHASVALTILSFGGLQWWAATLLDGFQAEGLVRDPDDVRHVLGLLLSSGVTIALLANFVINAYMLAMLCLKSIFFLQLYSSEIRTTLEHLFNYVVYKGAFLPFILTPSSAFQVCLWSAWLVLLSSLKVFQTLAKDRLERLNASPSATYGTHCRVFSALLFVLFGDVLWISFCIMSCRTMETSLLILLFLEPLSIAFETTLAITVHGFQLLEMRQHQSLESSAECMEGSQSYKSAGGSLLEWKSKVVRNFGFILDVLSLLMALGHYLMIWWLHGMAFHVIDTVLFLNSRTVVTAIIKKIRGFIKLRKALTALDVALPDATCEEIAAYDDECAICREPMSRAKKLSCNHLFHLSCLRSWLDQGLNEAYSCPTCRRPLIPSNSGDNRTRLPGMHSAQQSSGQANLGLAQPRSPNNQQNADSVWRGSALDDSWIPTWPSSRLDGAGTSAIRPVSLGRVQLMMRQLASMSESYGHGALEDASWNPWPPHQPSVPSTASSQTITNRNMGGLRFRNSGPAPNISDILAMAERVREVLPHLPDELIIEDLQRTNNPTATVNNFLPT